MCCQPASQGATVKTAVCPVTVEQLHVTPQRDDASVLQGKQDPPVNKVHLVVCSFVHVVLDQKNTLDCSTSTQHTSFS